MKNFIWLYLLAICMSACTGDISTENSTTEEIDFEPILIEEEAEELEVEEPEPVFKPNIEMVEGVPVYNKFDDIEYLFHQHTDTTYVINFWATWCKPCVEELPYLEKLNKEYQDEKVKVILVSMDFKKLIHHKLTPFLEKNAIQSDVVLLADGYTSTWIDRVSNKWDGAIPYSIIYRNDEKQELGIAESYNDIESIVKEFLKTS